MCNLYSSKKGQVTYLSVLSAHRATHSPLTPPPFFFRPDDFCHKNMCLYLINCVKSRSGNTERADTVMCKALDVTVNFLYSDSDYLSRCVVIARFTM